MKIKICGITNLSDALNACEAGADALGFVFYDKSPRYIAPKEAAAIIEQLPPFVQAVGLFTSLENIKQICDEAKIGVAQLHFDNAPNEIFGLQTIKVVRAKTKAEVGLYSNEYRLVDSFVESYGGAGKKIDISWFDEIDTSKIVVAGGLNSGNIAELLPYGFYGFDVSSGVELEPGRKDKQKMREFIHAAKGHVY